MLQPLDRDEIATVQASLVSYDSDEPADVDNDLTDDSIDCVIAPAAMPILFHDHWQQRLNAGDMYALSVAYAVAIWRGRRVAELAHDREQAAAWKQAQAALQE